LLKQILLAMNYFRAHEPLPSRVTSVTGKVIFHLKGKVVIDTARCFGAVSTATKFEKQVFEKHIQRIELLAR